MMHEEFAERVTERPEARAEVLEHVAGRRDTAPPGAAPPEAQA